MRLAAIVLMLMLAIAGCSNSDESGEKSKLAETQEKIANEAVEAIKTPIDQAKLAKELTEQHNQQVEGQIEKQQ